MYNQNQIIFKRENSSFERIVALGDIHGDLQLSIDLLMKSPKPPIIKEVKEKGENVASIKWKKGYRYFMWDTKNTMVVQVGDQVDRCRPTPGNYCHEKLTTPNDEDSDEIILKFYTELDNIAIKEKKGNRLISLIGNHEVMNLIGKMDYVSYEGIMGYGGKQGRINAFKAGTELGKLITEKRHTAVIVHDYLFIHAGIIEKLIKLIEQFEPDSKNKGHKIVTIIQEVTKKVLGCIKFNSEGRIDGSACKSAIKRENRMRELFEKISRNITLMPFFDRALGNLQKGLPASDSRCVHAARPIIEALGVKSIIIGHSPVEGINSTCDGQVWRIDVAASEAFDNVMDSSFKNRGAQVLQIKLGSTADKDVFKVYK
jgi:hypothetical protein